MKKETKNGESQQNTLISHGFGPFYDENSTVLILGSFPSVKSREQQFYYGHPQNRFWKVMSAICQAPVPRTIEEKKIFLRQNHIALYDVIESCTIQGSSDSSIRNVTVTDLAPILEGSRIENRIFTNGAKAYQLYMRYIYPQNGVEAIKLPSTSPANAAWSLERLTDTWREAVETARKK